MNMDIPLPERLGRWSQWLRRENDRPLIGFFLDSQYPLHRFRCRDKLPAGVLQPEMIQVESFLDEYDRHYELYESVGGDLVWTSAPFWGAPWVEASLGCKVIADHQAGATRTEPPADFATADGALRFRADNPWAAKMLEFIPALAARSGGRYPVGVTLMRGISDLLSACYGPDQFIFRLMEAPDEAAELVEQLTDYWIDMGRCLLDHLPLFQGGTGVFFYNIWSPGKMIYYQDDAAALLSPALYERFILPATVRIAQSFPHSMIHLHPSQFIPVDYLMETELDVIELHRDVGGPTAQELLSHYQKILSSKSLIIGGDLSESELEFILRRLPPQGLAVMAVADSAEQSRLLWDKAMQIINE